MLALRTSIQRIYDYQYQVMPFAYTHLVALIAGLYLLVFAVFEGQSFQPHENLTYGLLAPAITVVIVVFSALGLIEIGTSLANPYGSDAEDFAVFHFLKCARARRSPARPLVGVARAA